MKAIKQIVSLGQIALVILLASCGDSVPKSSDLDVKATETSLDINGSTASTKVVSSSGDSFFLKVNSPKAWTLSAENADWLKLSQTSGEYASELGVVVTLGANAGEQRQTIIVLKTAEESHAIQILQQAGIVTPNPTPSPSPNPSPTPNPADPSTPTLPADEKIDGEPFRIEIPKLAGGSQNYFITHKTTDGLVNYSLEYDTDKRHSRWVAFVFDSQTARQNHTKRTNAWGWDPKIPSNFSTERFFSGSGYSRGHLVASSDRYYSREANEQTFYYSNMSPQLQDHNGGIWQNIEQLVQGWGRNASFRDELYVVKGGTIRDDQIESRRIRGYMVIPKYYYMALVVKKGNSYHGIAFWTEHRNYSKSTSLRSLTISIDELESRTGIDFFPNLPDDIENAVEAETASSNWPGL